MIDGHWDGIQASTIPWWWRPHQWGVWKAQAGKRDPHDDRRTLGWNCQNDGQEDRPRRGSASPLRSKLSGSQLGSGSMSVLLLRRRIRWLLRIRKLFWSKHRGQLSRTGQNWEQNGTGNISTR